MRVFFILGILVSLSFVGAIPRGGGEGVEVVEEGEGVDEVEELEGSYLLAEEGDTMTGGQIILISYSSSSGLCGLLLALECQGLQQLQGRGYAEDL